MTDIDVFISYHDKTNGARAVEIAGKLESAGIRCWCAKRDVPAGGDFTDEVIKQIGNCKVFLLLFDEGAARSPHVETEVGEAFGHKKIMPYQTDTANLQDVEWVQYYLKQIQIVPLPDYDTLTKEIATALGRPVQTLTPEPQPVEPEPETVTPKPQPEGAAFLDGLLSAFILLDLIAGLIGGFMIGRQTTCSVFFSHFLDDLTFSVFFGHRSFDGFELSASSSGVLGAFAGYSVSCFINIMISIHITDRLSHARTIIAYAFRLWFIISLIVGGIAGYMTNGILGAFTGVVFTMGYVDLLLATLLFFLALSLNVVLSSILSPILSGILKRGS